MAHHTSGWAERAAAYAAPVPSRAGRDRAGGNVAPPPRRVSPAPGRRDGEHSGPPPQGGRGPEGVLSYRMWREGGVSAREVLLTSFLQWSVELSVVRASVGPLDLLRIRSGFALDLLWFCFGDTLELLWSSSPPRRVSHPRVVRIQIQSPACKVGPASYRVAGRGRGWEAGVRVSVAGARGGHAAPVMLVW